MDNLRKTVFIFDWDDTLLPSTWLENLHCRLDTDMNVMPIYYYSLTEAFSTSVKDIIDFAASVGDVYIVTNSDVNWVEMSTDKFIPSLASIFPKIKEVISAKSTYEIAYPDDPFMWKHKAVEKILSRYIPENTSDLDKVMPIVNFISVGDSIVERKAAQNVSASLSNVMCKTVKFIEKPDLVQLKMQLLILWNCIQHICDLGYPKHIDIKI